jgi:hypothetical protein
MPAIQAASPPARPYTGQAELGGQVRSQAGAWERGQGSPARRQAGRFRAGGGQESPPFEKGGQGGFAEALKSP